MISEGRGGKSSVTDVALVIAVGEPCCDFSQVALPDRLTAQRTERLRAGCPAIDQDEFHVSPPSLHLSSTPSKPRFLEGPMALLEFPRRAGKSCARIAFIGSA